MKKLLVFVIALVAISTFSCKKGDQSQTYVNIVVKSDLSGSATIKSATLSGTNGAGEIKGSAMTASMVTLDSFFINVDEIEFELDDDLDDNDDSGYDYYDDEEGTFNDDDDDDYDDEFKIKGPVLINLLSDEAGNGLFIAAGDLPYGQYEEIEVKLDKYTGDPASKMYNHTILIKGQIDGQDMKMWYNGDIDIDIDFPDDGKKIALTGAEMSLYIDFYLNKMLDNLNAIDFIGVKDGNGNGIIEIGPDDVDGNKAFARHFVEALLISFDLDDDDDDDDNED